MSQEQYNVNWDTYHVHLKEMMASLMDSNGTADVTLVCDDKIQFKAHKFILNSCSPVFQSIINDLPQKEHSVIFLRGVFAQEMKSILQFMYLGQATFYQERINEFLNVAKILEIKEISKDVDCEDTKGSESGVNYNYNVLQKTESSNLPEVHENSNNISNEMVSNNFPQGFTNALGQNQCTKCDKVFINKKNIWRHFQSVHGGVNYQCNECDKSFSQKYNLIRHTKNLHEGENKYPIH